jgi:hypothetical protein
MSVDGFIAGPDDDMDWVSAWGRVTEIENVRWACPSCRTPFVVR